MKHFCTLVLFSLVFVAANAASTPSYAGPAGMGDEFDQAYKWSPSREGHRLGVAIGRTNLWYGQPFELTVVAPPGWGGPRDKPLRLTRVWWSDLTPKFKKTATVELQDHRGKPIEHSFELFYSEDGVNSGHRSIVRLVPEAAPGGGLYFPPGKYRVRVRVHMDEADADANSFVGTLESPWIDLEIWSTEPTDRDRRIKAYLAKIEKQFENGATNPTILQSVERDLGNHLFEPSETLIVPALELFAGSEDVKTAEIAKRLLRNLLFPIVQMNRGLDADSSAIDGPTLGIFGDTSWEMVSEIDVGDAVKVMRIKAARYSPLPPHVDLTDPTDEQVRDVIARLRDDRFEVRMAAVRSIGQTADPRLLEALVERFGDPYGYYLSRMPCIPVATHPVADLAAWRIARMGAAAEAVLLVHANDDDVKKLWRVHRALVQMGPRPAVLKFFGDRLTSEDPQVRLDATYSLGQLGSDAAPLLRAVAADTTANPRLRALALSTLASVDRSDATIKLLRVCATDAAADETLRGTAMRSLARIAATPQTADLLRKLAQTEADESMRAEAANVLEWLERQDRSRD